MCCLTNYTYIQAIKKQYMKGDYGYCYSFTFTFAEGEELFISTDFLHIREWNISQVAKPKVCTVDY